MTTAQPEGTDLPNLKRAICVVEAGWVCPSFTAGVISAVILVPALAFAALPQCPSVVRLLAVALAPVGVGVGAVLGTYGARRIYRRLLKDPHSFALYYHLYYVPVRWPEWLRRTFSDSLFASRRTARALGMPFEAYRRWYRADHRETSRLLAWFFLVWFAWGGLWLGTTIAVATGPLRGVNDDASFLAVAPLAAACVLFWSGLCLGFAIAWGRRYRPMLQAKTGLSVLEVMREFGYRPVWFWEWLIGWWRR